MIRKSWLAGALAIVLSTAGAALAQTAPAPAPQGHPPPQATVPQSDMLLATLWTQRSVEFKANALTAFTLFAKYAESKGVKVFYITNRGVETEADTRKNMEKHGFPMGGNVDIFLMQNKQQGWGSAKGTRRATITKDYRVILNVGDNFGDFDDAYRGSEAQRLAAFEANRARWGREWIMIANPTYGSFDTAPFGHDFKKSRDEQRKAKIDALEGWSGPK
jgi:predicted secreted acid phosphatase